jgi:4-amino-4-deoxy-L-arabinose transferase-like glycosyltransferase
MTTSMKHPRQLRSIFWTIGWIVFLVIILLLLNLPWSPVYKSLNGDSGLYAYIGKAILHGQLPYRDVWEQKPPIGFYLNAVGLLIFGQNMWGVWWFNLSWLILTISVFFFVVKKLTGPLAAGFSSLVFIIAFMGPDINQGGNLLELYALIPQILIIAAAYHYFSSRNNRWIFFLGLFTALAFLTKQTTIALGFTFILSICVYDFSSRQFTKLFVRLGIFLAGVILPVALVMLIWLATGAFGDFMDAVFWSSLAFAGAGALTLKSFSSTLGIAFLDFPLGLLFTLAITSGFVFFVTNRQEQKSQGKTLQEWIQSLKARDAIMPGIFLALPMEILLASAGGYNLGHYFLTCLPAVMMAIAYLAHQLVIYSNSWRGSSAKPGIWAPLAQAIITIMLLGWLAQAVKYEAPTGKQLASISTIFERPIHLNDLEKYIVQRTAPNDTVLVWHIYAGINFDTDRRPPTPYLYPLNLFIPIGNSYRLFDNFLADLESNPPEMILFQKFSSIEMPFVNIPLDEICAPGCQPQMKTAMQNPGFYKKMEEFKQFFDSHYYVKDQVYDWLIYRLIH